MRFFDIGTLMLRSSRGDQIIVLHGVRHPELFKVRIHTLRLSV